MNTFRAVVSVLAIGGAFATPIMAHAEVSSLGSAEARCRATRLFAERLPLYQPLFSAMGATPTEWVQVTSNARKLAKSVCSSPSLYIATPEGAEIEGFLRGIGQRQAQALGMNQAEGEASMVAAFVDETKAIRRTCDIEAPGAVHWMSPAALFEPNFRKVAVGTCDQKETSTPDGSRAGATLSGTSGVSSCLQRFAGAAKGVCNDPRATGTVDAPIVSKDAAGTVTTTSTWRGTDGSYSSTITKSDAKGVVIYVEVKSAQAGGRAEHSVVIRDDKAKNEKAAKEYEAKAKDILLTAQAIGLVGGTVSAWGPEPYSKSIGVSITIIGAGYGLYGAYVNNLAARERNKRCHFFQSGQEPLTYRASSGRQIDSLAALRSCMCRGVRPGLQALPGGAQAHRTASQGGVLASLSRCPSEEDAKRADCLANLYGANDKPRKECMDLLRGQTEIPIVRQRLCRLVLCQEGHVARGNDCACLPSTSSREHPDLYGGTACERIKCEDTQVCECTESATCGCKSPLTRVPGLCEGEPCPTPGRAPR